MSDHHMQDPKLGGPVDRMEFLLVLRKRGIGDAAVLRAMDEVPRDLFVDQELKNAAYEDQALPIACGQTISQPYVVAYMTEQLRVAPEHRVLEIGTGSGYQAAILSRLVREVVSIERYRTLAEQARARMQKIGAHNVEILLGDGFEGAANRAPFDRIMVTAAAEDIPEKLVDQLSGDGGVMILPLGPQSDVQHLVRLTKTGDKVEREQLIAVRFVPMLAGKAKEL